MKRTALIFTILSSLCVTAFAQDHFDGLHYEVTVKKNTAGKAPEVQKFIFLGAIGEPPVRLSVTHNESYIASASIKDGVPEMASDVVVTGFKGSVHPLSVDKSGVVTTDVAFEISDLVSIATVDVAGLPIQKPNTTGFKSKATVLLKPGSEPMVVANKFADTEISIALKN